MADHRSAPPKRCIDEAFRKLVTCGDFCGLARCLAVKKTPGDDCGGDNEHCVDSYCDIHTNQCELRKQKGESCDTSRECEPGVDCQASTCGGELTLPERCK